MLKTTFDRQESLKKQNRYASPATGSRVDTQTMNNPFKFIEGAIKEAKAKIQKMDINPDLLDNIKDNSEKKQVLMA